MPRKSSNKKDSSRNQTTPIQRNTRSQNNNTTNSMTTDNNNTEYEPLREGNNEPITNNTDENSRRNRRAPRDTIRVFGFDVTPYLTTHSVFVFVAFSLCHIGFSIIFASLQEVVNSFEGFKFPQFMTIIQTSTYTLCAFVELKSMKGELGYVTMPRSPIYKYIILSVLTFGGMFFTNSGLKYVSYPTRIIFKAGKPLPTMGIEMLTGRLFPKLDVANVIILTLGITLFCFGEARDIPSFNGLGIFFMSIGVIADSMTSNYEKKAIFSDGASHAEAMFFASLLGSIWTLVTLMATDYSGLLQAISFCVANPSALCWLIVSSIGGYMSVVFIMLLIKCFSATYTECVKGIRKVLSIAFSYLFIASGNKSFNEFHGFGMACFLFSTGMSVYLKTDIKHIHLLASQFMSRSQFLSRFMSRSEIRGRE